jgi:acyl-CoA thioester hydrolase
MKTKICKSIATVRFQDSDPFNHLNNAKYLDYFMNAREDHLIENYGIDPYEIAMKEGVGWVVASNKISYFKPAMTMEKLLIETQLIGFKDKHLFVEGRMYDESGTELKSVIWMHFVHFNLAKQKSVSHKPEMVDLLNELVEPVDARTFDERSKDLMMRNAMSAVL